MLLAYPISMTSFRLIELNGDFDGYADTNETVDLFITVSNPRYANGLTNVVISLTTNDPKIDCITPSTVTIPSLPPGTAVEATTPFRVHVHPRASRGGADVTCNDPGPGGTCSNFVEPPGGCLTDADCWRTADQGYSAVIAVSLVPASCPTCQGGPRAITLDLDLDSSSPSVPTTTFAEGFEFGFGAFAFQNVDDNKASNSLSDGYRCQYNDPDFENSNSYGETYCYLGFASGPQFLVNDWHVHSTAAPDGGRAFLGNRSLHYGVHTMGNPDLDTYGLSQLDAFRTKSNINLAARICQDDPAADKRGCATAADCGAVGGGPCVPARPELSFKHQVSTVDERVAGVPDGTVDRAVVHVQPSGSPIWHKAFPYQNTYDDNGSGVFDNCMFDPIDDGNDEDDYFDPTDPNRRLGPSSTCYPEFVFNYIGDTDDPFDPAKIGRASEGPGLQGSLGLGTWVESKFDLSRYRGRSIKIRFLFTSIKVYDARTHEAYRLWNPTPGDDGWYLDDVRVSQSLGTSSSTVTIDTSDNSGLPGNADGDARGDDCDCALADPGAFAAPAEVEDLRLAADKETLTWESALAAAGSDTVHDVIRGALDELPVGTGPSEICLASGIQEATATDPTLPASGTALWYLVRARNACGVGTYGFQSDGSPRTSTACP